MDWPQYFREELNKQIRLRAEKKVDQAASRKELRRAWLKTEAAEEYKRKKNKKKHMKRKAARKKQLTEDKTINSNVNDLGTK